MGVSFRRKTIRYKVSDALVAIVLPGIVHATPLLLVLGLSVCLRTNKKTKLVMMNVGG